MLLTFTAMTRSHSSSFVSTTDFQTIWAALLTSTSTRRAGDRGVDGALGRGRLGDVAFDRRDGIGLESLDGRSDVHRDDGRAALGQQPGDRAADAARRSGDDRDLAVDSLRAIPRPPVARVLGPAGGPVDEPEMLLRELARRPVADDGAEVAPAHRHVAEDALYSLAVAGGARAGGAEDLPLHRVPGQGHRLAGDRC